jgi:hypothetical protein
VGEVDPLITVLALQLADLTALVDDLSDDDFALPTRCAGWAVAELVAHCEGMLIRLVGENCHLVEGEAEIDRVGYYRFDPDGPREGEDPNKSFSEIVRDRVIAEAGGRPPGLLRQSLHDAVKEAWLGCPRFPSIVWSSDLDTHVLPSASSSPRARSSSASTRWILPTPPEVPSTFDPRRRR